MGQPSPLFLPRAAVRRGAALGALALGVLLLHEAALTWLRPAPPRLPPLRPGGRVELVAAAPPRAAPAAEAAPAAAVAVGGGGGGSAPHPAGRPTRRATVAAKPSDASNDTSQGAPAVPAADERRAAAPAPLQPAERAGLDAAAAAAIGPVRLAPPQQRTYTLTRGALTGQAQLSWQHDGAQYDARLVAMLDGRALFDWHSRGAVGEGGLAPQRLVVRNRGRGAAAANLDHARGHVSWSGRGDVQALSFGAQDRLSWLVQLPGILAASPERIAAGASIELPVVGAHGDAALWRFTVQGIDAVVLDGAAVPALRLQRLPAQPWDVGVQAWLDAAPPHLPLRLRFEQAGRETLELQWSR